MVVKRSMRYVSVSCVSVAQLHVFQEPRDNDRDVVHSLIPQCECKVGKLVAGKFDARIQKAKDAWPVAHS